MFDGLSEAEAAERLKVHGFNELSESKPKSVFRIVLEVMKEPMFVLLICCGGLYMILGDYQEGVILLASIFVIIFISFYQYQKTERALDALRNLASPRALVRRSGKEIRIPGREVVPGDILMIREGDRIPADARLLEGHNLSLDESLLTGESVPVSKLVFADDTDQAVWLYGGTLVVRGDGFAEVQFTGTQTQFGKIGTSLSQIDATVTHLQKEMKSLIRNLFIIGAIISVGVVLAYYLTRGHFIQSLLHGLAASMAILPEEFPVVLTIFLALGVWRLSEKKVLTRKPSAIETLGSATVLCSDKTGTITLNQMDLVSIYDGNHIYPREEWAAHSTALHHLWLTSYLASAPHASDPMEKSIATCFSNIYVVPDGPEKLMKEYPLSRNLLAMSRAMKSESGPYHIYAKGAPEAVFLLCRLDPSLISKHMSMVQLMAEKGYRVIAAATAIWNQETLPESQLDMVYTFQGLLFFEDPIRPEIPEAIRECDTAGIRVMMITGDFPTTALSISRKMGLPSDGSVLTGAELQEMDEQQLKEAVKHTSIYARIVPEQKLRIVKALKANGEIVSMTGDGVNDAPALKYADIGIAMGGKGTDVAREASSLVLLDDNFASIVAAIRSGRKIYDNLQKAMSYILAIHIPIIGLTLLPAFFPGLFPMLLPLHIVFMELIIDPVCSIAFESEGEEKGIMERPPRQPNTRFFGWRKMLYSLIQGSMLLFVVLGIYFLSIREGHQESEVRAIAFSALIIGNIFLILTSLSKTRSIFAVLRERNKPLIFIISLALVMLAAILYFPPLQKVFSFGFPGFKHFITAIAGSLLMLLILEVIKYIRAPKKLKSNTI